MRLFGIDRGRTERLEFLTASETAVRASMDELDAARSKVGRLSRYAQGLCRIAEEVTGPIDPLAVE